jgi:uncharacterized cupredoxin-like copper-binding protein
VISRTLRALTLSLAILAVFGTAAFTGLACGGDDGDGGGVEVIGETPGSEPDPEADPDPEPDPEADPVAELTPGPKPEDATQVDVTLGEWEVVASPGSVAAGKVYFRVTNNGPADPHEFVVIKSDLEPAALPVEEGKVPEDDVDLIDEIEPFAVGSTGSITLELEPGAYVLICNIAEEENGVLESHYGEGMRTSFTVQ